MKAADIVPSVSTRDRLSAEAAKQFAATGYHGTSIGSLATALGIRKASVYSHIRTKEDLLAEIALAGAKAFHDTLDAIPEATAPVEQLRLALSAHFSVVDQQLDVATVWLQEWRYLTGDARESFLSERRRYGRRIREMFEAAVADGSLRPDLDLRHAVLLFFSVANWAYTWMRHDMVAEDEADQMWALLQAGLA